MNGIYLSFPPVPCYKNWESIIGCIDIKDNLFIKDNSEEEL